MNRLFQLTSAALLIAFAGSSCTTLNPYTDQPQTSRAAIGSVLGGALGAGIGALSGSDSKERRKRALIGAGIGVLAGGGIGLYMDRQEARLRQELRGTGVSVTRRGDDIILNMPGNITFATNSASIDGQFFPVLNSVTKVLKEFNKTLIDVAGHTDSTGGRNYNYDLSNRRARSVADYLSSRGIQPARFYVQGYGPDHPIAANGTAEGRQHNRRVEITLQPLR